MISKQTATLGRVSPHAVKGTPVVSVRCAHSSEQKPRQCEPQQSRRAALACLSAFCALQTPGWSSVHPPETFYSSFVNITLSAIGVSQALGIESLQSIFPDKDPKTASNAVGAAGRKKLQDAEDSFQSSELLKRLREQTTQNSKKYCTALPLCIACIHDVSICPLSEVIAHPSVALMTLPGLNFSAYQ